MDTITLSTDKQNPANYASKKTMATLISALLFSFLFYKQNPGVNFLIFNLFLIFFTAWIRPAVLFSGRYISTALGSIITALAVFWWGSVLATISNIISLALLCIFASGEEISPIPALCLSAWSAFTSFFQVIVRKLTGPIPAIGLHSRYKSKVLIWFVPILFVFLFFVLYRASDPLFMDFTKDINLDFITVDWILFLFAGGYLLTGFYFPHGVQAFAERETQLSNTLENIPSETSKLNTVQSELLSGKILFTLLNIMILLVNIIDFNHNISVQPLPQGMTLSEYLHQGIGTLIISIFVAIGLILFYFRKELNFISNNRFLKTLVYIWIFQNALLILSNIFRNSEYISEYSLTYKRIGVYVYLILCLIGLITTLIKTAKMRSNWYLLRVNPWLFFIVIVLSSTMNWDQVLTDYNLNATKKNHKQPDISYLLSLSDPDYAKLMKIADEENISINSSLQSETSSGRNNSLLSSRDGDYSFKHTLHSKTLNFIKKSEESSWRSWNHNLQNRVDHIREIAPGIKFLNLANTGLGNLENVKIFTGIEKLWLQGNYRVSITDLKYFPKLRILNLSNISEIDINKMPLIANLEMLDLSSNHITAPQQLNKFTNLQSLNLSNCTFDSLDRIDGLYQLKSLTLNGTRLTDLSFINNFPKLEILNLSGMKSIEWEQFPELSNLKELDLTGNNFMTLNFLDSVPSLQILNVENCTLSDWRNLKMPPFLKKLYLGNCNIEIKIVNYLRTLFPAVEIITTEKAKENN